MPGRTSTCERDERRPPATGRRASRRTTLRPVQSVMCRHCGTAVAVETCENCGREFALTVAHSEGRARGPDDGPLDPQGEQLRVPQCDFCEARARGEFA